MHVHPTRVEISATAAICLNEGAVALLAAALVQ